MGLLSAIRSAFGPAPVLKLGAAAAAPVPAQLTAPRIERKVVLGGPDWLRQDAQTAILAYARHMVLSNAGLAGAGTTGDRTKNFQDPSVRVFVTWSLEQRRAAITMADAGTLVRAADMCESMLGDDRVPAVLNTRANALLGTEVDFDAGKVRRGGVAKAKTALPEVLALEEDWWKILPEEELRRLIIWGVFLGVAVGQLVWKLDAETGRLVPHLDVWHPRFLRWDWDNHQWWLRVEEYANEIPITPGDGKWILFTPYGARRPWSLGLWRGMSLMWLLKLFACRDWALHSEIHGNPIRVGKLAPREQLELQKGTDALRKDLLSDLQNIGNDTAIVLPSGFDLDLVEATARTWQMFEAQIALANTAFAVAGIGSNLPTEVGARISTGATAATLVRNDYTASDGNGVATMMYDQVTPHWTRLNFGQAKTPWAKFLTEPPIDQSALSLTWQQVSTSVMQFAKAGEQVDRAQLKDKFDIVLVEPAPSAEPDGDEADAGAAPAPEDANGKVATRDQNLEPETMRVELGALGYVTRYLFQGLPIAVENPAGTTRTWRDGNGELTGSTYMLADYGYIEGYVGSDGEEIDVYVGPDESAAYAYVVHQRAWPDFTKHDEDKVILGCSSADDAKALYLAHRNDGERAFGGMSVIPLDDFKRKLHLRTGRGKIRATALDVRHPHDGSRVHRHAPALIRDAAERKAKSAHAAADTSADQSAHEIARALAPVVASVTKAAERAKQSSDPRAAFRRELRALAAIDPPPALVAALEHAGQRGAEIGHQASPPGDPMMVKACHIMASELRLELDGADFPMVRGTRTWVERVNGEPVRAIQFDYYVPADGPLAVDFEGRVARGTKHELRLIVASGDTKGAASVASGVFESAVMGYDDDQRSRHAQTGAEPMVQRVVFRGSWQPFAMPTPALSLGGVADPRVKVVVDRTNDMLRDGTIRATITVDAPSIVDALTRIGANVAKGGTVTIEPDSAIEVRSFDGKTETYLVKDRLTMNDEYTIDHKRRTIARR